MSKNVSWVVVGDVLKILMTDVSRWYLNGTMMVNLVIDGTTMVQRWYHDGSSMAARRNKDGITRLWKMINLYFSQESWLLHVAHLSHLLTLLPSVSSKLASEHCILKLLLRSLAINNLQSCSNGTPIVISTFFTLSRSCNWSISMSTLALWFAIARYVPSIILIK